MLVMVIGAGGILIWRRETTWSLLGNFDLVVYKWGIVSKFNQLSCLPPHTLDDLLVLAYDMPYFEPLGKYFT